MAVMGLSMGAKKKASDRRQARRLPVDAQGQLFLCPANSRTLPLHVMVKDVSETGVGVMYDMPLPLGQKYVVKQPAVAQNGGVVLFTVVRSERITDGQFSIGLHASHLLSNDFIHSERPTVHPQTQRMVPFLISALLIGMLIAMLVL